MAKKSDNSVFFDWLLLFGGVWLLYEIFKDNPSEVGIYGLPEAERDFVSHPKFKEDLKKLNRDEAGYIIRLIINARVMTELSMPTFKYLTGYNNVHAELRDVSSGARIFLRHLGGDKYQMIHFFFKKTNSTPKNEIEKANNRI